MTDWQTLSILLTSKLIHREASDVLYAHSNFRVLADWPSQSYYRRVNEKRLRNITFDMTYHDALLFGPELPGPDVGVFDLPDYELVFHHFAKVFDTEKALRRVAVCVIMPEDILESAEDGELEQLGKLGHRLAGFSGLREIVVELIYDLGASPWWPGTEPRLSATGLLRQLKPLFWYYTEEIEVRPNDAVLQRFIFWDPIPSQEGRLITSLDNDTTIDGEERPSSAIEVG